MPSLRFLATIALGSLLCDAKPLDGRKVLHTRQQAANISSSKGPVVDLGYTAYIGNNTLPGIDFYGGMRYIEPPLADLRWRSPVTLNETAKDPDEASAKGYLQDARNFGPICVQQPAVIGVGVEDCVTLNIWKPADATEGSNLPVVLYIHGGGNYYNSAQGFPMSDWVNVTNSSIIAISIQYRLGIFGYLASEALMANGSANAGLQDQRAAMEWVGRNIAKFGGDPKRLTISGESSGGGSVLNQLVWKGGEADPPFSAAILQSIGNDPFPTSATYEQCFGNVTSFVGCADEADVMACLRETPLSVMVSAVNHRPQPLCKYLPIVDGDIIRDFPSVELTAGHFSKMPIMAGHTTDDGTAFTGSPTSVVNDSTLYSALTGSRYMGLSQATFNRSLALYNQSTFVNNSFYVLAETLVGNTQFSCFDWYLTNLTAAAGYPAFNYRWNTPDPVQLAAAPYKGVMHTSDLYYLFDGTNSGVSSANAQNSFKPFNATEVPLSQAALSYWTSFVIANDPSTTRASGSPTWPALTNGTVNQRLVIQENLNSTTGTSSVAEAVDEAYLERCMFWVSVGNETRV